MTPPPFVEWIAGWLLSKPEQWGQQHTTLGYSLLLGFFVVEAIGFTTLCWARLRKRSA